VRNPAADRDVYLPTPPAQRSYLEPHHIEALLGAAAELDDRHGALDWDKVRYIRASDKSAVRLARDLGVSDVLIGKVRHGLVWTDEPSGNRPQRRAIIATLVLAGLRISELCGLPLDRLDLAGGRILIPARDIGATGPQTKTAAGERVIPMAPALHGALLDARAAGRTGVFTRSDPTAGPPAFCTRTGAPQTSANVAHRVLEPTVAVPQDLLRRRGQTPMPHTLRRTFASILAECDVPARRAVYLLGHRDAKLTLSVYQQVLDMGGTAVETLERVLGAPLEDVGRRLRGRAERRPAAAEAQRALDDLLDDGQ
jgi:integrase